MMNRLLLFMVYCTYSIASGLLIKLATFSLPVNGNINEISTDNNTNPISEIKIGQYQCDSRD